MPPLDPAILARRSEIVAALARHRAGRGRDRRSRRHAALRVRCALGLPPDAAGRGAARDGGPGLGHPALLPGQQGQGRAARRRHLAVGRLHAGGRRHPAGPGQVQPRARDRLRQPLRPRAARRHQPRHLQGGRARGLLLRARSQLADRLLDRRQRGGEFRRRALPEIRPHHQQPAGHRDGADDRRGRAAGRQASRLRRLRPDGPDDRLRRPAGRRHRGDGAPAAQALDGARRAAGLPDRSGRRRLRRRRHRLGHHPRRHGDDGQGRREVRRGLCRRGLSAWTPRAC